MSCQCYRCKYGDKLADMKISKDLREYGCSVVAVIGEHTYTLGINVMLGKPDVFIPSFMKTELAFILANNYNDLLKDGREFELDVPYSNFLEGYNVVFKKVLKCHYDNYFGQAINFYGNDDFEVWQMVLPDKNGLFPWDEGCADFLRESESVLFEGGNPSEKR